MAKDTKLKQDFIKSLPAGTQNELIEILLKEFDKFQTKVKEITTLYEIPLK